MEFEKAALSRSRNLSPACYTLRVSAFSATGPGQRTVVPGGSLRYRKFTAIVVSTSTG